ncbi:TPA-induced transmembrane protein [Labeo rohita]|uniref:TPA-induced transmembrane protein n=1 Tax=Labeo rohita TaxID=84645 RepID=UPI0021E2EC0B|nr:TPA-induced transmembrane protein [Labeo rohita]XP_050984598.1 TPA-induced transmembrane protein [Labeo rohita]
MSESLELKPIHVVCDNNNVTSDQTIEVIPGNGACSDHVRSERNEGSPLLPTSQVAEDNKEQHVDVDSDVDTDSLSQPKWLRELRRVKRELNEVVVWKLKLWTLILIILLVIALVIGISIIVCAVGHEDEDEKYDKSSFVVARFFRGNFTLDGNSFTSNSQDEDAIKKLEQKLKEVYSSSPALERYFSSITINNLQDTAAQFKLMFMMPLENDELIQNTLSLKIVKNVLLQHLYDRDTEEPFYIIPTSLQMEVG